MDCETAYWKQVDCVFAAASDAAPWAEALTGLADYFRCDGTQCLVFSRDGRQLLFGDVGRIDPAAEVDYEREYAAHDFRRPRYLSHPSFVPVGETELTTPAERAHSPFHQEFLRKCDCENLLLANFPLPLARIGVLVLGRSQRGPAFDETTRREFKRMLRPLQAALRVTSELETSRRRAQTLEHYVDSFARGVFLLGEDGRLLHANAPARRLMGSRRTFRVHRQKLTLHDPHQAASYERLLQGLRKSSTRASMGVSYLRLDVDHSDGELQLAIRRLDPADRPTGAAPAGFVITVVEVNSNGGDVQQALQRLYGLTPAEAMCASLLRNGCAVTDIARHLGIAIPTVRAHLQSLYRKTDTHRQGELIARLHRTVAAQGSLGSEIPD